MTKKMALCLFIAFAFATRFLNWPPNFSPLLAVGVLSGLTLPVTGLGILLPLALMIGSDLCLGFHETMASNYLAMVLIVLVAKGFKHSSKVNQYVGAPALSALLFFVVSNLGVFWLSDLYVHTVDGLSQCFLMALPFFPNTLVSTIFFSSVFLSLWNLIEKRFPFFNAPEMKES